MRTAEYNHATLVEVNVFFVDIIDYLLDSGGIFMLGYRKTNADMLSDRIIVLWSLP